jgi:flagellar hook protein FlgE
MGFQQGLSGLSAASKQLEVIGNNVANSSTVGFKQSQAQFADVYAASLSGATSNQSGIGVKVAAIAQQFSQGTVTASNNPLDLAINGNGFFRMETNGAITYTRNGQFQLDKNGFVVTSNNAHLTGYSANTSGVLSTGAPADININTADIAPIATGKIGAVLNLNSGTAINPAAFNANDSTTYSNSTSVSVFDSLGNSHVLQTFYEKKTASSWNVYATLDGAPTPAFTAPATQAALGTLNFTGAGAIDTATTTMPLTMSLVIPGGATSPQAVTLDYTGTTQFGAGFGVTTLSQDGFTSGKLSGFGVGNDGIITGRYTNGKSSTLGQVVLASFKDPNGLTPLGNNSWAETSVSGAPLVGPPNSGSLGVLQSAAVEVSNVDLTAELVNMITAQRAYQANAQTIKTEDQIMQTLVNLR